MRRLAALLGLIWALLDLIAAYVMVTSAFMSKTAAKEGILSQSSLLFGGLLIALFAVLLMRQCARMMRGPDLAGPSR